MHNPIPILTNHFPTRHKVNIETQSETEVALLSGERRTTITFYPEANSLAFRAHDGTPSGFFHMREDDDGSLRFFLDGDTNDPPPKGILYPALEAFLVSTLEP
jgi:hypothetical protein